MRANCDWLRRPFAHRGLHENTRGIIENTASAIEAAIAGGYGVEVDLQRTADDKAVVFHDRTLERLTTETDEVAARDEASLRRIALRGSGDHILSLPELLSLVDARVPVLLEIKSDWRDDRAFEAGIAQDLSSYAGHVAVMSFDPHCVGAFRTLSPQLTRGLISERFADAAHWPDLTALQRFCMRYLLTAGIARPHFIAYDVRALPAVAPELARWLGLPLLTWTVRDAAARAKADRYADAMIFESIKP
jgi:glycerophosphoryl diester phosphodiesterase